MQSDGERLPLSLPSFDGHFLIIVARDCKRGRSLLVKVLSLRHALVPLQNECATDVRDLGKLQG